jgi:hypothetical protein
MSETERICRMLCIVITKAELFACECLEQRGFRFLIDFGYQNAIDKAALLLTGDRTLTPYRGR